MPKSIAYLVVAILFLAGAGYIGAIIWICLHATSPTPELLTNLITAVGGVLATNFGAILGISVLPKGGTRSGQLSLAVRDASEETRHKADALQVIAAYLYFGSLLVALVCWLFRGISSQPPEAIKNMTFTLVGVVAGVVAVALNVRREQT